jgi:hypothetical protein
MEDSLTRLDRLPQEEARMAAAQVRKVASTVNGKVRGIADNHASVDNRVAYIDDRVPVINTLHSVIRVKGIGIDDRVKVDDDRVKAVGPHPAGRRR